METIMAHWATIPQSNLPPANYIGDARKPLLISPPIASQSSSTSEFHFRTSLKLRCFRNQITESTFKDFSVLPSDNPWKEGSVWSTMAMYMFNLHIPLGIGGLSIFAYVSHQPVLDPQTQALSLLVVQLLELFGAQYVLKSVIKPGYTLTSFFRGKKSTTNERNWLLATAIGFSFLITFVFLSSLLTDIFIGEKAVNNPILKDILLSSDIARYATILVYCIIMPFLEETVYRGFLLTSLTSTMKWQHAVAISAAIFSAAHFSGENFLQLFFIGCVLGCSYCWTGNLRFSFLIHSFYNAFILGVTYLS